MEVFNIIRAYADQIGGTFTGYDESKSIVVVPLNNGRFQTVLAVIEKSKTSGKQRLNFTSKVGDAHSSVDTQDLLMQHGHFDYSKFVLDGNQIKVVASCLLESASADEVRFMVQEVAQLADHYELKLTGKDIH
jgi:hypothetical protein